MEAAEAAPSPLEWFDRHDVRFRPITPEDEALMIDFHRSLSDRSVYARYFSPQTLGSRVAHNRLSADCSPDVNEQVVIVAELIGPFAPPKIIGVGRLCDARRGCDAEFALVVSDAYQRQGFGGELLRRLFAVAKKRKVRSIVAWFLPWNLPVRRLCERFGMAITDGPQGCESMATFLCASETPSQFITVRTAGRPHA